jgi:glutathione peroxidase-family protein
MITHFAPKISAVTIAFRIPRAVGLALGLALTSLLPSVTAEAAPKATEGAQKMNDLSLTALDGKPVDPALFQGKVVLFVNVASRCGFTPQYAGLQKLYEAKKDAGLVIVGVPCNQFGAQEPGSPTEIASFCKLDYGVTFPLLAKQDVNGPGRSDLYKYLVGSEIGDGAEIRWNFEKFLVGRDGRVIGRYPSKVAPDSAELLAAIDGALSARP